MSKARQHCKHCTLPARQHCYLGSIASTTALPALQLCQNGIYDCHNSYGSFGSYSRMAGMVAMTAKAACQVWQLCQHGSYASTAAMSVRQLCYYGCFSRYMIDWQTMTTNDNKTTKNMVFWVANALTAQLKIGLLQAPTCLSRPGLTLFLPDLVTWRSYKGWFRPWPVGIGWNALLFFKVSKNLK